VVLPDGTTGAPNVEQARMIGALLGRPAASGAYVTTRTDKDGFPWHASLDCVDLGGAVLLYTTASGPLVFRRAPAEAYLTMAMSVDGGVARPVALDRDAVEYVSRGYVVELESGDTVELRAEQKCMLFWLVTRAAASVRAASDLNGARWTATLRAEPHSVLRYRGERGSARIISSSRAPTGERWFEALFGFNDRDAGFERSKARFEYTAPTLRASTGTWRAGTFTTPNLAALRTTTTAAAAATTTTTAGIRFSFSVGNVATLHDAPENDGAVFQAASQFNCLEFANDAMTPADGVAVYVHDRTQGPACAMACAPGTVVRNYFAGEVNTIRDAVASLGGGVDVVNGYTRSDPARLARLEAALRDPARRAAALELVRVGVQRDTQVTCTQRGSSWLAATSGNVVTQVYVSAVSVSYSGLAAALWEPFARFVLEAAYEATLHVAAQCAPRGGRVKVFLTSVGGGVFGNAEAWIADAIRTSLWKFRDAPLDVVLVELAAGTKLRPLLESWA
jgi:hypothetical protein